MTEPTVPPPATATTAAEPGDDGLAALVQRLAHDVAALRPRVGHVEARVEDLAGAVDDVEAALDHPDLHRAAAALADAAALTDAPPHGVQPEEEHLDGPGLDMHALIAWVRTNVADLIERRLPQTGGYPHWCASWWLHPEAIARFEALRRLWTVSVVDDGAGLAVYFSHLDAMLAVLCGEHGPFSTCHRKQHSATAMFLTQQEPGPAYFVELALFDELADLNGTPASAEIAVRG